MLSLVRGVAKIGLRQQAGTSSLKSSASLSLPAASTNILSLINGGYRTDGVDGNHQRCFQQQQFRQMGQAAVKATNDEGKLKQKPQGLHGISRVDMPFLHFPKYKDHARTSYAEKFKTPRKRASKLFNELKYDVVKNMKEVKPDVWNVPFKVGDAIEVTRVSTGGVNSTDMETTRGVVIGQRRRGLGTSVYLRDMLFGEPVEFNIPLHSPLIKSLKVLEKNFVKKGKKKIKRAKLFYLRERNPADCRVTKIKGK
jgi:large subunit ribosomal protein L19